MHSTTQSLTLRRLICRYLYLNAYALLLLFVGGGVLLIPLWLYHWAFALLQVAIAYPFIKNGAKILASWETKKREYKILMERNAEKFRPDTFAKYMEAPCGRLLVKAVLKDLGYSQHYKSLKVYQTSIWQIMRTEVCCRANRGAVIHFYDNEKREE